MARCLLGSKKIRKIEAILGLKITYASVRGGNPHYWASVYLKDGTHYIVNYKTHEVIKNVDTLHRIKMEAFDTAWLSGKSELEAKTIANQAEANLIAQWTAEFPINGACPTAT
jgi:hypothetical protein